MHRKGQKMSVDLKGMMLFCRNNQIHHNNMVRVYKSNNNGPISKEDSTDAFSNPYNYQEKKQLNRNKNERQFRLLFFGEGIEQRKYSEVRY